MGFFQALRPDDVVFGTYRGHALYLAKGGDLRRMMAELYGKATGCARGKGGSMHLIDVAHGVMGASAVVGSTIPQAGGYAYACKVRSRESVVASVFGDGAVEEGVFHESIQFAVLKALPVLFVCENNFYAASTPMQLTTLVGIAERAAAYGIPGVVVDGNDVAAVYQATVTAVARARSGEGPTLIECQTYRTVGHSRGDPGAYRPKEEVELWKQKDPIERVRRSLIADGVAAENEIAVIEAEADREIETAVAFAEASPPPQPEDALLHLYGEQVAA